MSLADRQAETRQIISSCGALLLNDHFVYASGHHGAGWIAKDRINRDPQHPFRLGQLLAAAIQEQDLEASILCGPAIGGVICAQFTALALGVRCVFAEREGKGPSSQFVFKRGYSSDLKDAKVVVVDDVVNTGFSLKLTLDAVRAHGGIPIAAAAWVNRGNVGAVELGVPQFVFLEEVVLPTMEVADCSLCAAGVPVNTDYAHGAELFSQQSALPSAKTGA